MNIDEIEETAQTGIGSWHVSLRFGPDVLTAGLDPWASSAT